MLTLKTEIETFELHSSFSIARGANDSIDVITVSISDSKYSGRGECRPYARYDETPQNVCDLIASIKDNIENGATRLELLDLLPAGAARNAVDCALWDLESKQTGKTVWEIIGGKGAIQPIPTVQTLSFLSPEEMAAKATQHSAYNVLKVKLGGDNNDTERLQAIQQARPEAQLVIDANEGWTFDQLKKFIDQSQNSNIIMIEQPLPKDEDDYLLDYDSGSIAICGDESIHDLNDVIAKKDFYNMMNIKLDKSGGLTHALQMVDQIKQFNQDRHAIKIMIGCMVCTSLAIAPHILLAQDCDLADLDGPGWLKHDRKGASSFNNGHINAGSLWGQG